MYRLVAFGVRDGRLSDGIPNVLIEMQHDSGNVAEGKSEVI